MQVRVFTLPFSEALGGFPDETVRSFLAAVDAVEVSDHLVVKGGVPYLALVVKHAGVRDPLGTAAAAKVAPGARPEPPPVREADAGVYKALRTWRGERANKDGVAPYVVATNRVLAEIASARPQSKAALGSVKGFGEARVARYADDLLRLVPPRDAEAAAPVGASSESVS